jgi:hypothetical protein
MAAWPLSRLPALGTAMPPYRRLPRPISISAAAGFPHILTGPAARVP